MCDARKKQAAAQQQLGRAARNEQSFLRFAESFFWYAVCSFVNSAVTCAAAFGALS
jgi:hypothetical protein